MSEQNMSAVEVVENVKDLVHPDELNKENFIGTEKLTSKVGYSSAADEPMDYIEEEEQMVFKEIHNVEHKLPSIEDDLLDFDEMDTDSSLSSPKKKSKEFDLCSDAEYDSDSASEKDFMLSPSGSQVKKSFTDCLNSVSNNNLPGNSAAGASAVSQEEKKKNEDITAQASKTDASPELEDGELNYEEDELFEYRSPKLAGDFEVSKEKLQERAKRFGLNVSEIKISEDTLLTLYTSLGIPFHHVRSGRVRTVRLNTIHMYGVEDMTIADILNYFDNHNPQSVEKINVSSCNVLFGSDFSAARAMLGTSFDEPVISGRRRSHVDSDEKDGEREKSSKHSENVESCDATADDDLRLTSLQPGTWRRGYLCPKSKLILLRFATIDDINVSSIDRKRKFVPFFKGRPGLISNSKKRKIMGPQNETSYYSSYSTQQRAFQTGTWNKFRRLSYQSDDESSWEEPSSSSVFKYYRNNDSSYDKKYTHYERQVRGSLGTWNKFRRLSYQSDDESSWEEPSSSSVFKYYRNNDSSYDKKYTHYERQVRGSLDENTVYAGNKRVYMSMYADSVKGQWQTVKPQPEESSPYEENQNRPLGESSGYISSSVQEAPEHYPRKVMPSRYQVWNPIAKDMVKASARAEKLEYYRPSYQQSPRQDDLRSKLQVPSTSYQHPRKYESGSGGDLRTKLQSLRSGDSKSRHRSPLMIKVSK